MRDENLSSMPYPKQMELLTNSQKENQQRSYSAEARFVFHSRALHAAILRPRDNEYTQGSWIALGFLITRPGI